MQASDVHGLYAIIPTPARPGADRAGATATVDLEESARLVDALIRDGANGLIVLGTTGECATLTSSEYEAFVACVLETVRTRIPTFVGTTTLGTHEVVERTRYAYERGADGILLGLPMWQPLTVEMAVRYYASIAELFPRLPIMVYANARAFRFPFAPEFWSRVVAAVPTVMAAKFSLPNQLRDAQAAAGGRVHFLPHETAAARFYELAPRTTTACWSTAASMGPEPALAVMRAIRSGDAAEIAAVAADLDWALEPIHAVLEQPEVFASYNIQIERLRIDSAGYCRSGPIRPPYDVIPDDFVAAARENGRRWRQLRAKYAAVPQ